MSKRKKTSTNSKRLKTTENDCAVSESNQVIPESTPEAVFQSLIEPIKIADFFRDHWEKKPLVITAKEPKTTALDWFSKAKALKLLEEFELQYLLDVHFCICSDGRTKDMNKKGKVTAKEFCRLIEKMSATAQIHQVQRFVDSLWYVMEHLESLFGSLVGSNVYITPQGSQGLAPHYDDVEVFIFQLEGEKHWRLYKPLVHLAREYKTNLSSADIGEPTHEFILKPGDVLYMPRGTIHQADTPVESSSHSTHITISMYQKHSVGDFLELTFPALIEQSFDDCSSLRQGLPLGLYQKNKFSEITDLIIESLENLKGCLKKSSVTIPNEMIEDFMRSRLPPYGFDSQLLEESPNVPMPTLSSQVRLTYPKHVACVLTSSDDFSEDENSEDNGATENNPETVLIVYSSIGNSRTNHMIKTDLDDNTENAFENQHFTKLKFPSKYESAMELLFQSSTFIDVKSLDPLTNEEKLQLVTSLWAEHLLEVK